MEDGDMLFFVTSHKECVDTVETLSKDISDSFMMPLYSGCFNKLPELKQRLAKQYGISANSILSYAEWDAKTAGGKRETPVKYNVIIAPGEPDITANSHGVISTLLLKH